MKEIYVDGLSGLLLGYPTCKVVFSSNRRGADGVPINEEVVTLSMNAHALINAVRFLEKQLDEAQSTLENYSDNAARAIRDKVDLHQELSKATSGDTDATATPPKKASKRKSTPRH